MADNKKSNSKKHYNKSNNKNNRSFENNSQNKENNVTHEFSSYTSQQAYSNYYFGLNIFDLYSREQLENLVRDPIGNNKILRELSYVLYGTNGAFSNTINYMAAMPTLDRVIIPHGSNSTKKKRNKELMESVLRIIKDKQIIRDGLLRGGVEGNAYYYFETTGRPPKMEKMLTDYDVESIVEINELGINASIISLPTDYTRIIGITNNVYTLAFNLDYFNHLSGEPIENKLKQFPKEIRDAYNSRKNDTGFKGGNWVVLDYKKTIVHKIHSMRSEKYGRPLVLSAIKNILYNDYFSSTKRNVLGEINNKVVYQTLPEGQNKGTCALTKQQQQIQHDTVKNAIVNKNNRGKTTVVTVSAGTKLNTLDTSNTDIFDEKYESNIDDKIALDLGFAASALNGVGSGSYSSVQINLELVTAEIFQWVEQLTEELNKCISENIIKDKKNWVEVKYLPITHINKSEMVANAKDLYLQGKGSLSYWIASAGIAPEAYYALLDQELEAGIENKYPVHMTSYVMSGKKEGGRPQTDNPTDSTIQSRNNNGNALPSPSDK